MQTDDELIYREVLAQLVVSRLALLNVRHINSMSQADVDSLFQHKVKKYFGNDEAFALLSKQVERCIEEVLPANEGSTHADRITPTGMLHAAQSIDRYVRNIGLLSDEKVIFRCIAATQKIQQRNQPAL